MAVQIPTLNEIKDNILNDIATELGVSVSELGDTYTVLAKVLAGVQYSFYLTLDKVQDNIFPDLADDETLIRIGEIVLGRKPAPSESGVYEVQVTGTIGSAIKAATTFRADDTTSAAGFLFVLDQEYTLTATTDTITLRALTPGTDASLIVDDTLTSTQPISGVDSEVIVTAITTTPVSAEDIEDYRDDVITNYRLEPQGGSPSDYRLWALDVPEVRTVYVYLNQFDFGQIDTYVEATEDNTEPGQLIGYPTQATRDELYKAPSGSDPESGVFVLNPTTLRGRRPLSVYTINIQPIVHVPVDVNFEGLTDETISATLKTAIDDYLYDIRPYIAGADIQANKNDILTLANITITVINVLANTGITYTSISMDVDNTTKTTHTFDEGKIPYLRNITNDGTPI